VGWGVARLVAVRRREGRPDPAPGAGATEKESAISKKRKPSKKQKPSFKAPASPNVASANKPSKKTQPSLKTPNVTSGSESKPSFPAFTDSGERSPEADTYAASLKLGEAPELARCHIRQNSLSAALWANSFAGTWPRREPSLTIPVRDVWPPALDAAPVARSPTEVLSVLSVTRCTS